MRKAFIMFFVQAIWPILTGGQEPEFDNTPINVTAIRGQPAILPCTVLNKDEYMLIWTNHRGVVLSTDDRRITDDTRMSIERPFIRDWNLHIRNVQVDDANVYSCQINTNPMQSKKVRLIVQVPAQIDNATSSHDVVVREGQTVVLQCVATGKPEPIINWYRMTPQTNQMREQVGKPGEILKIRNITRYCGGLYECEADNNIALPVRKVINVDVEFPPEVTFKTPRRISQSLGKEVMLECFVAAFPQGVSQWNKDGKKVGEGMENMYKYRTDLYKEDEFTYAIYLRIIDLGYYDFGTYTCEASNLLGTDSDTILLTEYFEPTPPPTTKAPYPMTSPRLSQVQVKPYPTDISKGRILSINEIPHSSEHVGSGGASILQTKKTFVWAQLASFLTGLFYKTLILS